MLSVNIPRGELKGVQVRPMGDAYLQTTGYEIQSESENSTTYERQRGVVRSTDSSTDTFAYQDGYIVLTPLKLDRTDHQSISEVESWNLQLSEF